MGQYKKQLTYIDIVLATVGYTIGAGIFAVLGIASKYGKEYTWLSIAICGFLAICTGLSFSELASMFKKNGGEYYFVKEAINDEIAKLTAGTLLIIEILAITSIAYALSGYLSEYVKIPSYILSTLVIILLGFINYTGIRNSLNYNNFITIIEVSALIVLSLVGLTKNTKSDMFDLTKIKTNQISSILLGTAIIYFAFVGFELIIDLSEETINPETTVPNGMMSGLLIATVIYMLIGISAISSIGWKKLSQSSAPLAELAKHLLGKWGHKFVYIIALLSMSGSILMTHVGASRFIQGVSTSVELPFGLNKIDSTTNTPVNAIVFITILSILGLGLGNLENSVIVTNIMTMVLFFLINLSAIILRIKQPDRERNFKIPGNIMNIPVPSIIGVVSSFILGILLMVKPNLFNKV